MLLGTSDLSQESFPCFRDIAPMHLHATLHVTEYISVMRLAPVTERVASEAQGYYFGRSNSSVVIADESENDNRVPRLDRYQLTRMSCARVSFEK